ncbi:MAG: alkaline phosphatase D family protein [Planctomycetaceae bacterium]
MNAKQVTRREAIRTTACAAGVLASASFTKAAPQTTADGDPPSFVSDWDTSNDRVWLGEAFWANPMEDWKIVDGAAECQSAAGGRNVQLLTHQLTNSDGAFRMSVHVQQQQIGNGDGGAGFRIGVRSDINEHRANCFAPGGINAGIVDGSLTLADTTREIDNFQQQQLKNPGVRLSLAGEPDGDSYSLLLTVDDMNGSELGRVTATVPRSAVPGNVAIVNNLSAAPRQGRLARYRFSQWTADGDAFTVTDDQRFGPILWSMYSLSDSRTADGFVMKISALCPPLGTDDDDSVELQIRRGDLWKSLGHARLDQDAWTATFRIVQWDEKSATEYRLVYRERRRNGTVKESSWTGTIRPNPTGRPLRMAAMTCQKDYGFPYQPVSDNVLKLDPDLVYFSGDQLYEDHGGFGLIRDPADRAILNYLRKYYMFGWAFRDVMKDRPTLCIPDDHDVFQGNIWGEGGAPMKDISQGASSVGGYREPARMVNVVHKTNAAHHPDYFDPTPVKQNISVYYGDMVYGDVSFAIIADRQWKSGPEHVDTGSGRADHVLDPSFDTSKLDKPGLVLLGERQEQFLRHWVDDWRGHRMKVLLSQTVFAAVATHHGAYDGYLKADLDSGGWPPTARNNALRIIRRGMPLHINGDQHLTSLVQYGVDHQRDSNWSFCVPAISAGYPRWWHPDELQIPHDHRPAHDLPNTGEFLDSFGNMAYVYAVGNPEVGTKKNRYELAHQKGSGFGLVTIDPDARTYKLEAFRFLVDATKNDPASQFPGWPVVLHQTENRGENMLR